MTRYVINPGELRHRITFQELSSSQNDYGESLNEWIDIKTVYAAVYPVSGKEFFEAEKNNSEVSHKINIRYTSGLKPSMRIKLMERYFDIVSIINFQEKNTEIQILCKELFDG